MVCDPKRYCDVQRAGASKQGFNARPNPDFRLQYPADVASWYARNGSLVSSWLYPVPLSGMAQRFYSLRLCRSVLTGSLRRDAVLDLAKLAGPADRTPD